MSEKTVKDVLTLEVAPALGCTEPAALALGAAAAVSLLPNKELDELEIWTDPNVYKNGMGVSIPGTEGLCGLDMASALGAFGGEAGLFLEVLDPVGPETVKKAQDFVDKGKVKVNLMPDHRGIYVRTLAKAGDDVAESIIDGLHDHITNLNLNGEKVTESSLMKQQEGNGNQMEELETWLRSRNLADLLAMVDDLDDEDMEFLKESVVYNMRLTEYGLKFGCGLGIGQTLERMARQGLIKRDMILTARMYASAAADARMAGVKLPAMSSAGSGNHGLTAVLPIRAVFDYVDADEKTMIQAIGLSHIVTAYVKAHTGRLSAICGCSIAAGAGATAGITYLLGGNLHHISGAIINLTEDLAGVICDGAKAGCALKLSTAAGNAVQSALFALQGVSVKATDGIIGLSMEKTTQNVGELSNLGMIETDRTILKIMLDKQFAKF